MDGNKEIMDYQHCYDLGDKKEDGEAKITPISKHFRSLFEAVMIADLAVIFIRVLSMSGIERDKWYGRPLFFLKDDVVPKVSVFQLGSSFYIRLMPVGIFASQPCPSTYETAEDGSCVFPYGGSSQPFLGAFALAYLLIFAGLAFYVCLHMYYVRWGTESPCSLWNTAHREDVA